MAVRVFNWSVVSESPSCFISPSLHLSPRPQNPNSEHFNSTSCNLQFGKRELWWARRKNPPLVPIRCRWVLLQFHIVWLREIVGKKVKTGNLVTYWGWRSCEIWSFRYFSQYVFGNRRPWNAWLLDIFTEKRSQDLILRSCLLFGRTSVVFLW